MVTDCSVYVIEFIFEDGTYETFYGDMSFENTLGGTNINNLIEDIIDFQNLMLFGKDIEYEN